MVLCKVIMTIQFNSWDTDLFLLWEVVLRRIWMGMSVGWIVILNPTAILGIDRILTQLKTLATSLTCSFTFFDSLQPLQFKSWMNVNEILSFEHNIGQALESSNYVNFEIFEQCMEKISVQMLNLFKKITFVLFCKNTTIDRGLLVH